MFYSPFHNATVEPTTSCWYRDYRSWDGNRQYNREQAWYWVLFGKLLYIVVFEHFVNLVQTALIYLIPVESERVRIRVNRQHVWDADKYGRKHSVLITSLHSVVPAISHTLRAAISDATEATTASNPGRNAIRRGRTTQFTQAQVLRFGQ
jgi:hypothetical protein